MQPNPVRGVGPAGQTDHPKNQPHSIQVRCSSQYKVAVSAARHPNLVPTCVRAGNVGSGFWLCKFLHLGFRNFLEKSLNHTLGRQAFCLRLKIAGNSMPQYGNATLLMSLIAMEKRPSIAAIAFPPLIRNCPARGPAPQSTNSLTKSGLASSTGRVARTNRATYLMT